MIDHVKGEEDKDGLLVQICKVNRDWIRAVGC